MKWSLMAYPTYPVHGFRLIGEFQFEETPRSVLNMQMKYQAEVQLLMSS